MTYVQPCMVLHCDKPADQVWCSHAGHRHWIVEWYVCTEHHDLLSAGKNWAPSYETVPKWRRWLVMGDDLGTEVTPAQRWLRDQAPRRPADEPVSVPTQERRLLSLHRRHR